MTVRRLAPALALCVAAAVACGGGDEPPPLAPELVIGAAPTGQQPVSLPAYPPGSVGDGAEWPRACDLITDDEVRAVLPQATGVTRSGAADTIDYQLFGDATTTTDPHGRAREIAVPERTCTVAFGLPAVAEDGPAEAGGSVEVRITMVGSPDTVGYFWSPFRPRSLPAGFGAAECVQEVPDHRPDPSVGTFDCRRGELSVSVSTRLTILDEWHVRLAGRAANTDPGVAGEWFHEQVGPALLGVVARRMP